MELEAGFGYIDERHNAGFKFPDIYSLSRTAFCCEITAPLQKSYQELGAAMAGNNKGAEADPKQDADRLEKLFQLLEEAERQIPRTRSI